MYSLEQLQQKNLKELKEIVWQLNVMPEGDKRCRQNWIDAITGVNSPLLQLLEVSAALEVQVQELPIIETAENFLGVEVDQVSELIEVQAHEAIAQPVENFPGVEVEPVQESLEQVVKTSPSVESDCHLILMGLTLSDTFLARYSPPQSGNICFQSEPDGQLSLLDFEVQSEPEPPDPDDFQSLDAFREAIARWDAENSELLAASIDSMCEWAPCPEEWYWPKAEILPLKASSMIDLSLPSEQFEVMEFSIAGESSITCNFFIPTFDAWCDRFNRSDEPPDTGIYARLPKPKPPSFSLMAASQARVKRISNSTQTQPKLNPNAYLLHLRWQQHATSPIASGR